jgi:hypothetical protein
MGLKTARLTIDRSLLPQKWNDLGVRFERQSVAKIKPSSHPADMVLMRPAGSLLSEEDALGPEPRWNCIMCGMKITANDGTGAQGSGLLVITAQRFIGMIENGVVAGGPPLALDTSGHVFCFTFRRDDVDSPHIKKHRLQPSEFTFRSKREVAMTFQLTVFSALAFIANGKTGYWYDKNMLHALSEEGRDGLLQNLASLPKEPLLDGLVITNRIVAASRTSGGAFDLEGVMGEKECALVAPSLTTVRRGPTVATASARVGCHYMSAARPDRRLGMPTSSVGHRCSLDADHLFCIAAAITGLATERIIRYRASVG